MKFNIIKTGEMTPQVREGLKEKDSDGSIINNTEKSSEIDTKVFRQIAQKKGIKPIEGGIFMMIDGIKYRHDNSNNTQKINVNSDGCNINTERINQVGGYYENNGKVAFVDEYGQMWVGASTASNINVLRTANYRKNDTIWVSFSMGEKPIDSEIYKKLRDVMTGKDETQLKNERLSRAEEIIQQKEKMFGAVNIPLDKNKLYEQIADQDGRYYLDEKKIINERLSPRIEKDDAGFGRRIYTINNQTFSFKGREELPIYPTCMDSKIIFLGENPNWTNLKDFDKYKNQLQEKQEGKKGANHFVVNKSLLGVIELAVQLGNNDQGLLEMIDELKKGIYSERALILLDALVAGDCKNIILGQEDSDKDSEAIILLSLLGDSDAQILAREDMELFQENLFSFQEMFKEKNKIENEKRKNEYGFIHKALETKDLCAVHATKYKPENNEGVFMVKTLFDATNGKYPRNTIHTSLNHKVTSHMHGSWNDANYVLVSPLEEMIEVNGLPKRLSTVDTFWCANPGAPIVFPRATLVAPSDGDAKELFWKEGNILYFKSTNLNQEDLINLKKIIKEENFANYLSIDINNKLKKVFYPSNLSKELEEQWDFSVIEKEINQFLSQNHDSNLLDFLVSKNNNQSLCNNIEILIKILIEESGSLAGLKTGFNNKDQSMLALAKYLSDKIISVILEGMNIIAVNMAIKTEGFNVKLGGSSSWGNSDDIQGQIMELGDELGVIGGAHEGGEEGVLVDLFGLRFTHAMVKNKEKQEEFNWTKYFFDYSDLITNNILKRLDKKTLRVLYASGLLNARY